MIGQTVSHYKIVEKLGSGGMGEVYKAEDTKLGRFVALKFLLQSSSPNDPARERFLREAKMAAALSHPHICTILEINEHEGMPFIAMEYLEGQNLKAVIGGRPMPLSRVVTLSLQIVEALAAAQAKGITHRDIKPSNIFVTMPGQVKILDFGLAKPAAETMSMSEDETLIADAPTETQDLTSAGTTVGTVAYMSPEQALGKDVDGRSDIFSLGAVMYEMVTGVQAFTGSTQAAIFDKILNRPVAAPARLGVTVPLEMEQILGKALEKMPTLRYQSAMEIHTDLQRVRRDLESGRSGVAQLASGAGGPDGSVSGMEITASPSGVAAVASSGSVASQASGVAPPASSGSVATPAQVERTRKGLWVVSALLVLAVVIIGALMWRDRMGTPALTEGDVLLLTDFVNQTGDPVFDGALKQALAVKLEESPYLNIFPERQVQEMYRFMNRDAGEPLTLGVGQEICERQGLKAIVTGEIAPLGSHYVVALAALECRTGKSLAREQVEAQSKEEVLAAVGSAAVEMRRKLGESLASIERFDTPLELATTSSLEALKIFSLGESLRAQGKEDEAIPLFKRAIGLDPEFAKAYAALGSIYSNLREWDQTVVYKTRAFELRDRVSEREELYISAHYYGNVTGEIDKQIQTYELFKQTYPMVWTPFNNLSSLYGEIGEYEKAITEGREALRLRPGHPFPHTNLAVAYMALGRLEEAKSILTQGMVEFGFVHYNFTVHPYQIAFLEGDDVVMRALEGELDGKAGEAWLQDVQAGVAASIGQLEASREHTRRAVEISQRYGFKDQSAHFLAQGAGYEATLGEVETARDHVLAALEISRSRDSMPRAAAILARAGALAEADQIVAELSGRYPTDTVINQVLLPIAKAAVEMRRGNAADAVSILESARPYDRAFPWAVYFRGRALTLTGSIEEAIAEFSHLIELRGVKPHDPVHTLALLGLARAYAAGGYADASREAYLRYFEILEDSDPGIPILETAREEFSQL